MYYSKEIDTNDFLIIFISADAIFGSERMSLKIFPSNFSETLFNTTTIDLKYDILNVLSKVKCKKLLLMDIGLRGGNPTMFETEQLCTLVASSELAYEDNNFQNGAFTKAVIEALTNKTVDVNGKMLIVDENKDGFVSINELFEFVSPRVQTLVRNIKNRDQVPQMNCKEGDLIFFKL